MNPEQSDVDAMYRAKIILDSLPRHLQNKAYTSIQTLIDFYLQEYCSHKIIIDDIDNHLEYCTRIAYCEKCFTTFNR